MKSFLICGVLFLVLAVDVFCQTVKVGVGTLTLSGYITSGVLLSVDDVEKKGNTGTVLGGRNESYFGREGRIEPWAVTDFADRAGASLQTSIHLRYDLAPGGFRLYVRANSANLTVDDKFFPRLAFGWVNLFQNTLRVSGGYFDDDYVWSTGGDETWNLAGTGIRFEFKPFGIPALKNKKLGTLYLGAFLDLPSKDNTDTVYDENWKNVPLAGDLTINNVLNETAFLVRYNHPWVAANVMYKLDGFADNGSIKHRSTNTLWSAANEDARAYYGVHLTGVKRFKLQFSGVIIGLGNWEARGRGEMRQRIEYAFTDVPVPYLNNFTVGVKTRQRIWGFDMEEWAGWDFSLKPWVAIRPFIKYTVRPGFTVGAEFQTAFGHNNTEGIAVPADRTKKYFVMEDMNFYVRPEVSYNFNAVFSIHGYYTFNTIKYGNLSGGPAFADRAESNLPTEKDGSTLVESVTSHQFGLQFRLGF
jgi:hypothetical protein